MKKSESFGMTLIHSDLTTPDSVWTISIRGHLNRDGTEKFNIKAYNPVTGRTLEYPSDPSSYDAIVQLLPEEFWPPLIEHYKPEPDSQESLPFAAESES